MPNGMKLNISEFRIIKEVDKAICIAIDELKIAFWIPRSICELTDEYIFIPEWFWNKKTRVKL